MTDPAGAHESTNRATTPRVLIFDVGGPSAYPEDGITLLERWANLDPPNNPTVGAITKTTTSMSLSALLRFASGPRTNDDVR